jgi:tRNA pseudouridine13 synthase
MVYYSRPEVYLGDVVRASLSSGTFKVYEEIYGLGVARPSGGSCPAFRCLPGQRMVAVLCKRGLSTLEASWILERLGVRVTYWGIKDAEASSCQFVIVKCLRGITLDRPVSRELCLYPLGDVGVDLIPRKHQLSGNLFEVVLRHSTVDPSPILQHIELSARLSYLNYFGYQRFGTVRPISHLVGKAIAIGDYLEALNILIGFRSDFESPTASTARKLFSEGDFEGALRTFPRRFIVERSVLRKYIETADPRRAILQGLPRGMVRFFVEAYQSYLFNRALSSMGEAMGSVDDVGTKCEVLELPRPGLSLDSCSKFSQQVLQEDLATRQNIDKSMFVRTFRETVFRPKDIEVKASPNTIELHFKLSRGCYATVYLRELLRENLHIGS